MEYIEEKIVAVDVVDVTVIGVKPVDWPRVNDFKPVANELEAWSALNNRRTADDEGVLAPEAGPELLVRDVNALAWRMSRMSLRLLAVLLLGWLGFVAGGVWRFPVFLALGVSPHPVWAA